MSGLRPSRHSGEERGLLSRTAVGDRAYAELELEETQSRFAAALKASTRNLGKIGISSGSFVSSRAHEKQKHFLRSKFMAEWASLQDSLSFGYLVVFVSYCLKEIRIFGSLAIDA